MLRLLFTTLLIAACDSPLLEFQTPQEAVEKKSLPCELKFASLGLCGNLNWISPPSTQVEGGFELDFSPLDTTVNAGAINVDFDIHAYLWMPDMVPPHGSAPLEIQKTDERFVVENLWFIMAGLWHLHVEIKDNGQVKDKSFLAIEL